MKCRLIAGVPAAGATVTGRCVAVRTFGEVIEPVLRDTIGSCTERRQRVKPTASNYREGKFQHLGEGLSRIHTGRMERDETRRSRKKKKTYARKQWAR